VSDAPESTRVFTIEKESDPSVPPRGTMCCALMTTGARRKAKGRGKNSFTVHGKAKRLECPRFATRYLNGKPYCASHAPSKYRIDPFYETPFWRALRARVLSRDQNRCRYCGDAATQADHVMPRAKGGADAMENLVACCATCNKTAAGNLFPSFSAKKAWVLANRPKPRQRKKADARPTALLNAWQRDVTKIEKETA
jgi:5-methylcytosine-specific restriction endonuclease McrA